MAPDAAPPAAAVRIWRADLDGLSPVLEAAEAHIGLLSASERAWQSPAALDVHRWRRLTRIALRLLLAREGAAQARGKEFAIDALGKPSLLSGGPAFSVSHTGGLALLAIASRGPVGIDLERERKVHLGAARRSLIEAAAAAFAAKAGPISFLSAWTCLEAFAKARGSGIGMLLTELGITASGVRQLSSAAVAASAEVLLTESGLGVASLALADGCHGALAVPRELLAGAARVHALGVEDCRLAVGSISAAAR